MSLRRRQQLARTVALGLSSFVCSCSPPERPPDVVVIVVDTLRADHLQCYGYDKPTSPFIDTLAERGVRFSHVFAQASWTLPSHLSLLTSRYPSALGIRNVRS